MYQEIVKRKYHNRKLNWSVCLGFLIVLSGTACKKLYNLPDDKEFISSKINYDNKSIEPILGRWGLHGGFNSDNSSFPMTFEIVNARYGDGRKVTDMFQVRPTYVWTAAYDGDETTLEQIEAKRKLEDHPLFEVRSSGEFMTWPSATNDLIEPRPSDSSKLAQDIRYFDLKVTNSGGTVTIKDFKFIPFRERPYFPDNDINHYTGAVARNPVAPNDPSQRDYIRPWLNNIWGETLRRNLESNDNRKDVVVYIRPFTGGNGHNLRFKFLNKDSLPMNPAIFNETKWDRQVHGFNRVATNEYVQYDVAYPIPLTSTPTRWISGGNARCAFSYSRKGFGGSLTTSEFGLDFKIFRPGDWEIVFHFKTDNPKFEDE